MILSLTLTHLSPRLNPHLPLPFFLPDLDGSYPRARKRQHSPLDFTSLITLSLIEGLGKSLMGIYVFILLLAVLRPSRRPPPFPRVRASPPPGNLVQPSATSDIRGRVTL